ncbi:glutathione S-transferase family protein [Amaricoccus sp.]|uniref:glutathione S-transferase family protein n=1 Tax=Amaricoccus sp. TaxID=1872485 RepID=UPI001B674E2D|nr:glutathione S-transferase [Amaricoccus sp.]MBP7243171.1 glutathione S-transferase N-terminal domain-containing protein [Amaricoccus sp.]
MSEYRLYGFAQSGNSYKAALMLSLNGADWEPVFVDFFNGGSRTPEYRAINEMGEAPVLEHGETRLSQSGVILDYLGRRFRAFAPQSEADRLEVLRWTLWDNHKLTSYIASHRFLTNFVPEEKRDAAVIAWLDGRAKTALKVLESHLEGREWIVGDRPSTADLSCVGYLYFGDELGFDEAAHPNIVRWRAAIAALPGWKHPYEMLPGYPLPGAAA